MDQSSTTSSAPQDVDKLIITIPFDYNHFVIPSNVLHQSLSSNDWRSEKSSTNVFFQKLPQDSLIYDNLSELRSVVDNVNNSYASQGIMAILNDFRITESKITVSIIGSHSVQEEMNNIRMMIFKSYTQLLRKEVTLDLFKHNYLFNNGNGAAGFKSDFLLGINQLSNYEKCSTFICSTSSPNKYSLFILGTPSRSMALENKIRLFIDSLNPLYYTDYVEIEKISLLPLIGGTEFSNFKTIVKQTNCQLYLPNIVPQLFYEQSYQTNESPKIYITGVKSLVLLAKKQLGDIIAKIRKNPFIKQVSVMPIKRELLILLNSNDKYIKDIMFETGCYISLPYLGQKSSESGSVVSFQANSIESIDLAVDAFMSHFTRLYTGKYNLSTTYPQNCDVKELLNFSDTLSFSSNTLVSVSNSKQQYCFQVIGLAENIKSSVNSLSQFKGYINSEVLSEEVTYQIELPNIEKDFIAGKKNGKIIKIMNMSSVQIKLLPFTECNFIIEISCNDLLDSTLGLGLFEDELPTSITFNIPESFHRQIIGVGGQTVQSIMRKFNVFIKFSNSFELNDKAEEAGSYSSNFQQSFTRKNNVVIKCPSKNKNQIPLAKTELESLVKKVMSSSYFYSIINLTNCQWRLMISEQCNNEFNANKRKPTNFITEFEKITSTYIQFPKLEEVGKEQEMIQLVIYGVESNSVKCATEIKRLLPLQYKFSISADYKRFKEIEECCKNSKGLAYFTASQLQLDFLDKILVPLRLLFNIEIETFWRNNTIEIVLHYYPSSFSNQIVHEELSLEKQQQLISTIEFKHIIVTLSNFLSQNNLILIGHGISEAEFNVTYPDSSKKDVRSRGGQSSPTHSTSRTASLSPQKENGFNFMFAKNGNNNNYDFFNNNSNSGSANKILQEQNPPNISLSIPMPIPASFQLYQEPMKNSRLFNYNYQHPGNLQN